MSGIRLLGELKLPLRQEDALAYHNKTLREHYEMLREVQDSFFIIQHVAPTKLWEGMIRLADGTDWDPGSGMGLYQYLGGSWVKL